MIGEERLAEAGRALGAGQVRPADEAAQAPIAGRIAGQEDEVRAARPGADRTPYGVSRAMPMTPG